MSDNKIAMVTGASRGIGDAVASALAADGWDLILTCRSSLPELLAHAQELTRQFSVQAHAFACDMGNSEAVTSLFRQLEADRQIPSLLVNNAGAAHIGLLQDMSDAQWEELLHTNLSSVFYTCRAAIPLFLRQSCRTANAASSSAAHSGTLTCSEHCDDVHHPGISTCSEHCNDVPGRIINISSVWGIAGASCEVAYSAAKGGVNAFTKALAKELAPSGIPVNALAFGCIDTAMNHHLSQEEKAALAEEIPAGRFASPAEAAAAVLQLVHAPSYLTGQIIAMDGGWL